MALTALLLTIAQAAASAAPSPAAAPAATGPIVTFEVAQGRTALGTIAVALESEKAPQSVGNFLEYVRAGHYDGTVFHRVIQGFMLQGGGFTPDMQQKPTRPAIVNEAKNGLRNSRGTIAMARLTAPNSATSQFFINLRDNHMLDYGIAGAGYAVFGHVVDGMDVVDRIAMARTTVRGPHQNVPEVAVVIRRAQILKPPATTSAPTSAPTAIP